VIKNEKIGCVIKSERVEEKRKELLAFLQF
jgi:hypothetical protein